MATNFLQFDTQQTNMLSDEDYQSDRERIHGFTTGISRSIVFNKAVFQSSTMAAALAQVISDRGLNAIDSNFSDLVVSIGKAFPESRGLPIGSLLPVTQLITTPPEGFLLPDGSAFNPAEYPELAQAYRVSGNTYAHGQVQIEGVWWPKTPNLMGYFVRVHNQTSNTPDGNRVLGSKQNDAIRNIKGECGNYGNGNGSSYYSSGAMYVRNYTGVVGESEDTQGVSSIYGIDASRTVPTANENRPYNVALTHLIVAKTGANLGSLANSVAWGYIIGDLNNQPDLKEALDSKQDKFNTQTITLLSTGWASNSQTVSVAGMTANSIVWVSPEPTGDNPQKYTSSSLLCSEQDEGTLTFTCGTVPSDNILVNVVFS